MRARVIHLASAIDRVPFLQRLEESIPWPLEIVPASNGANWWANPVIPKQHPWRSSQLTQGMMGCAESHIRLLKGGVDRREDLIVFEDDCEMLLTADGVLFALQHIRETIQRLDGGEAGEWDILLLGANEYVDAQPVTPLISRISRFWGTHAMILRERAVREVLQVFVETQKEGVFMPADWLYNETIKRRGLRVYGPSNPRAFCRQIPGLRSDVTGGVRGV